MMALKIVCCWTEILTAVSLGKVRMNWLEKVISTKTKKTQFLTINMFKKSKKLDQFL